MVVWESGLASQIKYKAFLLFKVSKNPNLIVESPGLGINQYGMPESLYN